MNVLKNIEKKAKKEEITFKTNKKGMPISWLMNFLRCSVIPIYYIFKPFRYYGQKKLNRGKAVLVCNHYTLFDIIYPGALTWEALHFLSKKENLKVPVLGAVMRKVKALVANRDGTDVRVLLDSMKCLKNEQKIVIFPEGTRNRDGGEMLPFHHGAALMAIKAKAPVVPMVIYNKPKLFGMTHILMGEPIEFKEYYDRKLTDEEYNEADNKIRERMIALREEHTQFLNTKKEK